MSILVKIADLDLNNKTVLIREDYNVPLRDGRVADDTRIVASLPTLREIGAAENVKIIIVAHLGRPIEGEYDAAFSLRPVAECLSQHLGEPIPLLKNWIDGVDFGGHKLVLCENVRFERGEKDNEDALARKMAALCNIYVNDAFATAHRVQASTYGVAKYTAMACAGPLLISELKALSKGIKDPERPLVAVVGGAKISTKLVLLESLVNIADQLIVGGGIANTLLRAAGYHIGRSLYEADLVGVAEKILQRAETRQCAIPLPVDVVCAKECNESAGAEVKPIAAVADDDLILDVGPETTATLVDSLAGANTIVWNGPLGAFEFDQFGQSTGAIAAAIAASPAYSIAGGGDTLAAVTKYGVTAGIDYISTGGGAFLEFLAGQKLPAIAMLEEATRAWVAMEHGREL